MNHLAIAAGTAIVCLLTLLWLVYRYSFLVPAPRGLPILMYHKVSRDHEDGLTISASRADLPFVWVRTSIARVRVARGLTWVAYPDSQTLDAFDLRAPRWPRQVGSTHLWQLVAPVNGAVLSPSLLDLEGPTALVGGSGQLIELDLSQPRNVLLTLPAPPPPRVP